MAELSSQTLHIVARELNTELNEARAALETFGDQQDNVALLRRCGEHLHAVHGALRVSEVYGAALLAEEMGQVVNYLVENFAEKRHLAEGLDALMRSMVLLVRCVSRSKPSRPPLDCEVFSSIFSCAMLLAASTWPSMERMFDVSVSQKR